MNNNEFLESTPFALERYPRMNIRDLKQDYHEMREWFHAKNPECLPIKTSPLYCKEDCTYNKEGPHDLYCHNVNTNDWKEFRFSCPKCRKVYPNVPVFFANFREKFRDLVLGWYFIVTFSGTNLTEISEMTGLPMFLLYEMKLKFEATIVEAKRLVSEVETYVFRF